MGNAKKAVAAAVALIGLGSANFLRAQEFRRLELSGGASFGRAKFSARRQGKLVFSNAEFRATENFGSRELGKAENFLPGDSVFLPGFAAETPKKISGKAAPFLLSAKGGLLGASGLYGRLSAPSPELPSGAFLGRAVPQRPLDLRLPSLASAPKPLSLAVGVAVPLKGKFLSGVTWQGFVQADGTSAGAAELVFSPAKKIDLGAQAVAGRFYFGHTESSWVLKRAIFPERWFQEFAAAVFFKSPGFSAVATGTAHEQPDGGVKTTLHAKTTARYGPLQLSANFFSGGREEFFCGQGQIEKTQWQFVLAPQVRLLLPAQGLLGLNFGAVAAVEILKGDGELAERLTQKYVFGAQLAARQLNLNFFAAAKISRASSSNFSSSINFSAPKISGRPSLALSASVSEPASKKYRTLTQKARLSASTATAENSLRVGWSLGISLAEKLTGSGGGFLLESVEPEAALELAYRSKHLWITGKVTAAFDFSK